MREEARVGGRSMIAHEVSGKKGKVGGWFLGDKRRKLLGQRTSLGGIRYVKEDSKKKRGQDLEKNMPQLLRPYWSPMMKKGEILGKKEEIERGEKRHEAARMRMKKGGWG